jgi:hypothetical protein
MVYLKVISQTPEQRLSKIKCTNILWVGLILEQFMSITLQILEVFEDNKKIQSLVYMNRVLTILTEGFLITSQWVYALFFLKKKREKNTQEKRALST